MRYDTQGSARKGRAPALLPRALGATFLVMAGTVAPGSAAPDRAVLEALRASAAKRGGVRVIVSVAPVERGAETTAEVEAAKSQLVDRLRGPDAPTIEPIEGTPYVVMELTPNGVERLAADPAVQAVQEDLPQRAQ